MTTCQTVAYTADTHPFQSWNLGLRGHNATISRMSTEDSLQEQHSLIFQVFWINQKSRKKKWPNREQHLLDRGEEGSGWTESVPRLQVKQRCPLTFPWLCPLEQNSGLLCPQCFRDNSPARQVSLPFPIPHTQACAFLGQPSLKTFACFLTALLDDRDVGRCQAQPRCDYIWMTVTG